MVSFSRPKSLESRRGRGTPDVAIAQILDPSQAPGSQRRFWASDAFTFTLFT